MFFTDGHIAHTDTAANAVMSEVFAMQCCGEQAHAVMSEHFAQKSACMSFNNRIYYRYL